MVPSTGSCQKSVNTPVVFLVYKRPKHTEKVLDAIRQARPKELFVVADGPKNQGEEESTSSTIALIKKGITWDCSVKWNIAESNMGLANRVSSGITWAMRQCNEAIILEDDCLPDPSFFPYCAEMLEMYSREEKIMSITGDNFQKEIQRGDASYYFSFFHHCWGWATWKRAWDHYDHSLTCWTKTLQFIKEQEIPNFEKYWEGIKSLLDEGNINSWAYRWIFSIWARRGLTITPNLNLVQNIGYGDEGTHTKGPNIAPKKSSMIFPLKHPSEISVCSTADKYAAENWFKI